MSREYYSDCRSRSVGWSWECISVHHLKPVLTISCLWALSELSVRENRFYDSIQSSLLIWWKYNLVIEWDLSRGCGGREWDVIYNEGEQVHRVLEKAPTSPPAFSCFLTLGELTRTVWLGDIECTLDTSLVFPQTVIWSCCRYSVRRYEQYELLRFPPVGQGAGHQDGGDGGPGLQWGDDVSYFYQDWEQNTCYGEKSLNYVYIIPFSVRVTWWEWDEL